MISFELKPALNSELRDKLMNETKASMAETRTFKPKTKLVEKDNEFFIALELPGLKKDDLKILIENNELVISGVKKSPLSENEKTNIIINETFSGKFTRKFTLSDDIDLQTITAKFESGILIINLKKNKIESQKKEIEIL